MLQADELVIDYFAGGGGTSEGVDQVLKAIGRHVDYAINHNRMALSMHAANHPETRHVCEDAFAVDPMSIEPDRPVGLMWFSPDCTFHSNAKGGKPIRREDRRQRGLAWVVIRWAKARRPRIIALENVREFRNWGMVHPEPVNRRNPRRLTHCKLCKQPFDGRPCPKHKGVTFKSWCSQLRNIGYTLEFKDLAANDHGAGTIRKRLIVIARLDKTEITWPKPTHGPGFIPYVTAADCIDWSIPGNSIFLTRKEGRKAGVNRPLADKTLARIAAGIKKYVLGSRKPFIVPLTHAGDPERVYSAEDSLCTITGANCGEQAIVDVAFAPFIGTYYGANRPGGDRTADIQEPLRTQSTENRFALASVFLAREFGNSIGSGADESVGTITAGGGGKTVLAMAHIAKHYGGQVGCDARTGMPTVTGRGTQNQIVTTYCMKMRGTNIGSGCDEPLHTVSADGRHHALVQTFLEKYLGAETGPFLVWIDGEPWRIVDITIRMLTPRELFRCQGFPDSYIIEGGRDICSDQGKLLGMEWIKLTATDQVYMCGNSVPPPLARAVIASQLGITTTGKVSRAA